MWDAAAAEGIWISCRFLGGLRKVRLDLIWHEKKSFRPGPCLFRSTSHIVNFGTLLNTDQTFEMWMNRNPAAFNSITSEMRMTDHKQK